ncbi:MAG: hypothetical protein GXP54_09770 [Deltaproteobacteria bacterium]|nr:hypothetical protein [Deltaproteobacteria bacterium]
MTNNNRSNNGETRGPGSALSWPRRLVHFVATLSASVAGRVFLITLAVLVATSYLLLHVILDEPTVHDDMVEPWAMVTGELAKKTVELSMIEKGKHNVPSELIGLVHRSTRIMRIDVVDTDHIVRFSSHRNAAGKPSELVDANQIDGLDQTGHSVERPDHESIHVLVRPLTLRPACTNCHKQPAGTLMGHVIVEVETQFVTAMMQKAARDTLRLMVIVVLLLGLGLAVYVSRGFLSPARRIAAQMRAMGDADVPDPIPLDGLPPELRDIAHGFNQGVRNWVKTRMQIERLRQDRLIDIERLTIIGQMSAMMAHEIRNPLAGITGAVRVLASEVEFNEDQAKIVQEILNQSQRLTRNLNEFLKCARPNEPRPALIQPERITHRAIRLMGPAFDRKGIKLQTHVQPGTHDIYADEECVTQILLNLLLNAEQVITSSGSVRVEVMPDPQDPGFTLIKVEDDGPGMTPEVMAMAWEPFFTTKQDGTGLGLSISRELAERMGGGLDMESTQGSGTVVTIRLPRYNAEQADEEEPPYGGKVHSTGGGRAGRPVSGGSLKTGSIAGIVEGYGLAMLFAITCCMLPGLSASASPTEGDGPICLECHDDLVESAVKHEALDEGCTACHEPATEEPVTEDGHEDDAFKEIDDQAALCGECHDEIAGKASQSVHVEEVGCTGCHNPHSSAHQALLNGDFPVGRLYISIKGDPYALCMDCHEADMLDNGTSPPDTDFRNGEINLHALHVARSKGRTCRVCHDVHGSDQEHLIRRSVPFGNSGWKLEIRYDQTERGGKCATACHAPRDYERPQKPVDEDQGGGNSRANTPAKSPS